MKLSIKILDFILKSFLIGTIVAVSLILTLGGLAYFLNWV